MIADDVAAAGVRAHAAAESALALHAAIDADGSGGVDLGELARGGRVEGGGVKGGGGGASRGGVSATPHGPQAPAPPNLPSGPPPPPQIDGLKARGYALSDAEVRLFLARLDVDGDGTVSRGELVAALLDWGEARGGGGGVGVGERWRRVQGGGRARKGAVGRCPSARPPRPDHPPAPSLRADPDRPRLARLGGRRL